jgi:hypothetical protein
VPGRDPIRTRPRRGAAGRRESRGNHARPPQSARTVTEYNPTPFEFHPTEFLVTEPSHTAEIDGMRNREQKPTVRLVNPQTGRPFPERPKASGAKLTRAESAEYVDRELGYPMAFSTFQKLCASGEGPPVSQYWGRRPLHTPDDLKAWAEARARKTRPAPPSNRFGRSRGPE